MKHNRAKKPLIEIGWKEVIWLPEWGIRHMRIKADTGARSSAIDVTDIEELDEDRVVFSVALSRHDRTRIKRIRAKIARRTMIRSTSGESRPRLVVSTEIVLGSVAKTIEVTLVSRKKMLSRFLLGRTALADDWVVNSGRKYVVSFQKQRRAREG